MAFAGRGRTAHAHLHAVTDRRRGGGFRYRREFKDMRDLPLTGSARGLSLALLVLLMVATRSQHFADATHLPDASWAVFFLAGILCGGWAALLGLLALAGTLDYAAIAHGGASAFCISPAYTMLVPAYGALYLGGQLYARWHRARVASLLPFTACAAAATVTCELLSSGGFYFLSGRFDSPSLAAFGERLLRYFPAVAESMAFYLLIAVIAYAAFALLREQRAPAVH